MPRTTLKRSLLAATVVLVGLAYIYREYIWAILPPLWQMGVLLAVLIGGCVAGYRFRGWSKPSARTDEENTDFARPGDSASPEPSEDAGPETPEKLEAVVRAAVATAIPAALGSIETQLEEHQRQIMATHGAFQMKLQTRMDRFEADLRRAAADRPSNLIKAADIRDHRHVVSRAEPAPKATTPAAFGLGDGEPDVGFAQRDPEVAEPTVEWPCAPEGVSQHSDLTTEALAREDGVIGDEERQPDLSTTEPDARLLSEPTTAARADTPPPRPPSATLEDLLQECGLVAGALRLGEGSEQRLVGQLSRAPDKKAMLKQMFVFLATRSGSRLDAEFDWQAHRPALQNLLEMSGLAGAALILPGIGDQCDSETMNDLSTTKTGPRATVRQVLAPGFRLKKEAIVQASILT